MTPGARIAAAIELMTSLLETAAPADRIITGYFRERRYIGSRDRGVVAELVYDILRRKAWYEWLIVQGDLPVSPRLLVLAAVAESENDDLAAIRDLFGKDRYAATGLSDAEARWVSRLKELRARNAPETVTLNVPEWLLPKLKTALGEDIPGELAAIEKPAPVDLRVNTLKTTREDALRLLRDAGFDSAPTPYSPVGIRLARRAPIFASDAYQQGLVEVQDEGSQLAALVADPQPGERVLDFCAGAGGKTLALAARMKNQGRILALDVSEPRLEELRKRLKRAGVDNTAVKRIESEDDPFLKRHAGSAHRVIVDAPCSGSGTWRRNPDGKWNLSPHRLDDYRQMQQHILQSAAKLVRPGGELLYITCSLLPEENQEQAERFQSAHPAFTPLSVLERLAGLEISLPSASAPYLAMTPARHGTDGFFMALFRKTG